MRTRFSTRLAGSFPWHRFLILVSHSILYSTFLLSQVSTNSWVSPFTKVIGLFINLWRTTGVKENLASNQTVLSALGAMNWRFCSLLSLRRELLCCPSKWASECNNRIRAHDELFRFRSDIPLSRLHFPGNLVCFSTFVEDSFEWPWKLLGINTWSDENSSICHVLSGLPSRLTPFTAVARGWV